MKQEKEILQYICDTYSLDLSLSEAKETFDCLYFKVEHDFDFYIDIDGMEFRIIHYDYIWDIYVDTIKEITEDCYLSGNEMPSFLEVDWEKTAENCYADGYGHTFSSYDGSEALVGDFYIFRTN